MANNKECRDWITEDMYKVVEANCKTLLSEKGITQAQLAEITGFAPAAVSNYVNCYNSNHFPSIAFLAALQQKFGISIDEFISKELPPAQITPPTPSLYEKKELEIYSTYCGFYYCYYFDTSKYKGRDDNSDEKALLYGIIAVFKDPTAKETMGHSCLAVLGYNSPAKVQKAMSELEAKFDEKNISDLYKFIDNDESYSHSAYYGDFELNNSNVFFSLSHEEKDRALIILRRANSNSKIYTGGIGTINSVSRGGEPMPVVQFIGLSREFLDLPAEEIHYNLQLNYPRFKSREHSLELIKKFKDIFLCHEDQYGKYSDFDKELVISGNIDKVLKQLLKQNLFRYGKISARDDDEWYHFIKEYIEESKNPDN